MAQRRNPNILKLNISKKNFNNVHYINPYKYFQEDLYLKQLIEGFYFSFNYLTSEIIINRQNSTIICNFLLKEIPILNKSSIPSSFFTFSPYKSSIAYLKIQERWKYT